MTVDQNKIESIFVKPMCLKMHLSKFRAKEQVFNKCNAVLRSFIAININKSRLPQCSHIHYNAGNHNNGKRDMGNKAKGISK